MTTSAPESVIPAMASPSRWRRWLRRLDRVFVLTVAVPTLLAALYFGLVASDVYISESRFVVRSPQRAAPTGLSALLASAGISRSHDDTYTVHGYVLSRDALRELEAQLKLRAAYSAADIDLFSRFPGLGWDDSFEALFRHYTDRVTLAYDTVSSITTLQVRAYSPEMARQVNESLLQMSERLVNNLNDRSRQDLIVVAKREVAEAEDQARKASLALSAFRSKGQIFDPAREAALQIDTAVRLREELRLVEGQIAQLRQVAPDNPQIATLAAQARRLKTDIEAETTKALGQGSGSLNAKAPAYERLLLDKTFADQRLTGALASLDAARNDAARKQLYLERLVQPNLPDMALEPRRVRTVLTVFVLGLVLWGVVSLLLAGVREHVD
jgi:capsular polysaccharide transport system permease protein